jgi:hypothetical protein
VLLVTWLAGCTIAALLATLLWSHGSSVPGIATLLAALAFVLAGNATRAPSWATWPVGLLCAALGARGLHGVQLVAYAVLVATLMIVGSRFARLSADLAAFCLPDENAGGRRTLHTTTLADPVAREFARARRSESPLAVASVAVPNVRGATRQLARIARELGFSLRRTDVIVRAFTDRLLVVLPGANEAVALAVLGRALVGEGREVRVGAAAFPEDGPTWESLTDVAQRREQPWPSPSADNRATQHATLPHAEGARP